MASKRKSSEIIRSNSVKKTVTPSTLWLQTIPHIAPSYKTEEFVKNFCDSFRAERSFDSCGGKIINDPFLCCLFPNFLETDDFLHSLKNELLDLIYNEKNNDLYRFSQTSDLKTVNTPYISSLKSFLENEVLQWLKSITGIDLETSIDIMSSRYEFTDVLLCHDDELEGRRIAYMLYLVPPWEEKDGGALDMFSITDDGQPQEIVRSLYPKWNNFVFFEVTPKSFHQVAEILTENKFRLSVNGWFYGPSVSRCLHQKKLVPALDRPLTFEENLISKWISPAYLQLKTQLEIRSKFEEDSEIELTDFLNEELYNQVALELRSSSINWEMIGPPNKCHYEVAKSEALPSLVNQCLKLLMSEQFFVILSNLTGLKFHPLAVVEEEEEQTTEVANDSSKDSNSACLVKLTRWKWKSYTLMYDDQETRHKFVLDTYLFFNCGGWKNEYGGFISYIAESEDDELLTVHPAENSLALVYRDDKTNRFVKYVNKKVERMGAFHSMVATYVE